MNRFYVGKRDIKESRVRITGEDVKHITKVLRLGVGGKLVICDGDNTDYDGVIQKVIKGEIFLTLSNARRTDTEAPIDITLFQSIPKAAKMETIIQKGTELGIKRFVPVITSRTVVRLEEEQDMRKKIARWDRVALEAAKQSRRGKVPEVAMPVVFKEAVDAAGQLDLAVLAYAGENSGSLNSISYKRGEPNGIGIYIGPEGGFEEREIEMARKEGIFTIRMGPRILRTETAGIVLTSMLMYRFGDLGGW